MNLRRNAFVFCLSLVAALALPATGSAALPVLIGTTGPGFTISVKTPAGKPVTQVKAGRYLLRVRDRSAHHNFRLRGLGVSRQTSLAFVGTVTWTVTFTKGGVYRFVCVPHALSMRGRFSAV